MDSANLQGPITQTRSFQPLSGDKSSERGLFAPDFCPTDSFTCSTPLSQEQVLIPSPYRASFGENAQQAHFANPPSGPASLDSLEALGGDMVNVREKEWVVAEAGTRYVVDTGGCGAIKVFVEAGESSYSVVFHSDGSQESKEVSAHNLGTHILRQRDKPKAVNILCLQPYSVSRDVIDSVRSISTLLDEAGVETTVRSVCLNNIDGEKHGNFVRLNLEGSKEQILDRYQDLVLQSKSLSPEDRNKKIALFQSLPLSHRTPEFLKNWSSLSLEEAKEVVDNLRKKRSQWSLRRLFSRAA